MRPVVIVVLASYFLPMEIYLKKSKHFAWTKALDINKTTFMHTLKRGRILKLSIMNINNKHQWIPKIKCLYLELEAELGSIFILSVRTFL